MYFFISKPITLIIQNENTIKFCAKSTELPKDRAFSKKWWRNCHKDYWEFYQRKNPIIEFEEMMKQQRITSWWNLDHGWKNWIFVVFPIHLLLIEFSGSQTYITLQLGRDASTTELAFTTSMVLIDVVIVVIQPKLHIVWSTISAFRGVTSVY